MKIKVGFAALDRVLEKMGVEELIEGPAGNEWEPLDIELFGRGVDLNIEEIVVDSKNGTFSYKDRRVLVYIRSQNVIYDGYKFHVADCHTIQEMKKNKRFESRYVASTRTDGKFVVTLVDKHTEIVEEEKIVDMSVCKNCLKHINYKNYGKNPNAREKIYREFSLKEFFELYGETTVSKPKRTDISAPTNEYSPNWEKISRLYREKAGWKCEDCGTLLEDQETRKFLHVHHLNGDKTNNRDDNLRALCVDCHDQQEGHSLPEERELYT